jgi:glycosyltransferase involved in cell wall biosynthesis
MQRHRQQIQQRQRRLHVALVTETYPPEVNGVANTLAQLARGLARRGHRITLVRPRQPTDRRAGTGESDDAQCKTAASELLVGGLPLPGYRGLRFGLPAYGRLSRRWRGARPDAVYIATEGPLGHSALRAARILGIPTLTGFHTQFQRYCRHYGVGVLMRPIIGVLRRFHNRSDGTLVPTQTLRRELTADGFRSLHVLSRGVDTSRFSPARRDASLRRTWGCSEETVVALYVGRIAAEKNIDLALAAFDRIRDSRPDSRCILVGDGPELARLRRQHPDHIFTGLRIGEELAAHYASADLFVFPSLTETFGNVLIEALASGVAPIAFDYAAAGEHLRDGVNGYSVGMGDNNAFVARAEQAVGDRVLLQRMGQQARRTAESLSWERIIVDLETRLFSVIDCTGSQGDRHEPIAATAE